MEFIFIWIIFSFFSAIVASNKGRNGFTWFLIGIVIGPLGLILALIISKADDIGSFSSEENTGERKDHPKYASIASSSSKECPYCAETIKFKAIICRYCGKEQPALEDENKEVEQQNQQLESSNSEHRGGLSCEVCGKSITSRDSRTSVDDIIHCVSCFNSPAAAKYADKKMGRV